MEQKTEVDLGSFMYRESKALIDGMDKSKNILCIESEIAFITPKGGDTYLIRVKVERAKRNNNFIEVVKPTASKVQQIKSN